MNVFLWIVAASLAMAFAAGGSMKLIQTKEKLADYGWTWTEDFSAGMVKTIGALEVLAAIGLLLPPALGVAPVLAPLAALGLVLLMLGAAITHLHRKETQAIAVTLVILVLAAVVVWGRLGPQTFTT